MEELSSGCVSYARCVLHCVTSRIGGSAVKCLLALEKLSVDKEIRAVTCDVAHKIKYRKNVVIEKLDRM